jgi:hypothetical protein
MRSNRVEIAGFQVVARAKSRQGDEAVLSRPTRIVNRMPGIAGMFK